MGSQSWKDREMVVAIGYDSGDPAPKVLAKGYGSVAEAIIEKARENGIYVHDSPELVALLMKVDLDELIPEGLYQVVAELLVWLTQIDANQSAENL